MRQEIKHSTTRVLPYLLAGIDRVLFPSIHSADRFISAHLTRVIRLLTSTHLFVFHFTWGTEKYHPSPSGGGWNDAELRRFCVKSIFLLRSVGKYGIYKDNSKLRRWSAPFPYSVRTLHFRHNVNYRFQHGKYKGLTGWCRRKLMAGNKNGAHPLWWIANETDRLEARLTV